MSEPSLALGPSPFSHQRLTIPNSIRILHLLPALSQWFPIRCELEEVSLDELEGKHSYEALSYVWGSSSGTVPVICHGKPLLITQNCRDALVHLRQRLNKRALWIDAICIDQTLSGPAVQERNTQVQKMGDVYARADTVIIWLGVEDAYIIGQMKWWTAHYRVSRDNDLWTWTKRQFLRVRGESTSVALAWTGDDVGTDDVAGTHFAPGEGKFIPPYSSVHPSGSPKSIIVELTSKLVVDLGLGVEYSKYLPHLSRLLSNDWFSRVWTIQELAFSQRATIQSGRSSMSWEDFCFPLRSVGDIRRFSESVDNGSTAKSIEARNKTRALRRKFRKYANDREVSGEKLLSAVFRSKASRIHDNVYGFYALFRIIGIDLPPPDYAKSPLEVFEELTRAYIETFASLNILCMAIRPRGYDNMPTWVPDWTRQHMPDTESPELTGIKFFLSGPNRRLMNRVYASLGSSYVPVSSQVTKSLAVKGYRIGVVSRAESGPLLSSTNAPPQFPFPGYIPCFQAWCRIVGELKTYPSGGDPLIAFQRIIFNWRRELRDSSVFEEWFALMLCPDVQDHTMRSNSEKDDPVAAHLRRSPRTTASARDLGSLRERRMSLADYHIEVFKLAQHALLLLDSGHIGIAFRNCQVGDVVYVLQGANRPMVLRPHGEFFRFVAAANVPGVMQGEAWREDEMALEELSLV